MGQEDTREVLRKHALHAQAQHTLVSVHPQDLLALLDDAHELQVLQRAYLDGAEQNPTRALVWRRLLYRALALDLEHAQVDRVLLQAGTERAEHLAGAEGLYHSEAVHRVGAEDSAVRFALRMEDAVDRLRAARTPTQR